MDETCECISVRVATESPQNAAQVSARGAVLRLRSRGTSTGADCTRIIFDLRRSMDHSLHTERRKNENDRVQGDVKVDVFSKSLRGAV